MPLTAAFSLEGMSMNKPENGKPLKTGNPEKPNMPGKPESPPKANYTRDLILVAVLLVAALALFFGLRSRQARDTGTGAQAVVTVDGKEIGRYPLKKNGTFPLPAEEERHLPPERRHEYSRGRERRGLGQRSQLPGQGLHGHGEDQPQRGIHRLPAEPPPRRGGGRRGRFARGRHDLSGENGIST